MKISVILPNYNHADLVWQSIEGILGQSYRNVELIVVDDGSTDHSRDIIGRYVADDRLKPVFLEKNSGVNAALAAGLTHATGDLYFGAGADDYLCDPSFFEDAIRLLKGRPGASGVFGRSRVINKADDKALWSMGSAPREPYIGGQVFLDAFLRHNAFIPGSSVIFRLGLLREIGGFHPELGPQSDYYINHALAAAHGIFFINRDVTAFRVAPTTYSASSTDAEYFRCYALVEARLRAYLSHRRFDPESLQFWRNGVIHGRYNLYRCESIFESVQSFVSDLSPQERFSTSDEIMQSAEKLLHDIKPVKERLEQQKEAALRIFEEVAGPLPVNLGRPFNRVGARLVDFLKGL